MLEPRQAMESYENKRLQFIECEKQMEAIISENVPSRKEEDGHRFMPSKKQRKVGPQHAKVSVAHKIAIIFYTMVKNKSEYIESLTAQS